VQFAFTLAQPCNHNSNALGLVLVGELLPPLPAVILHQRENQVSCFLQGDHNLGVLAEFGHSVIVVLGGKAWSEFVPDPFEGDRVEVAAVVPVDDHVSENLQEILVVDQEGAVVLELCPPVFLREVFLQFTQFSQIFHEFEFVAVRPPLAVVLYDAPGCAEAKESHEFVSVVEEFLEVNDIVRMQIDYSRAHLFIGGSRY